MAQQVQLLAQAPIGDPFRVHGSQPATVMKTAQARQARLERPNGPVFLTFSCADDPLDPGNGLQRPSACGTAVRLRGES